MKKTRTSKLSEAIKAMTSDQANKVAETIAGERVKTLKANAAK